MDYWVCPCKSQIHRHPASNLKGITCWRCGRAEERFERFHPPALPDKPSNVIYGVPWGTKKLKKSSKNG